MNAISIADKHTEACVRRLAEIQNVGLTEAIKIAAENDLATRFNERVEPEKPKFDSLTEQLEAEIRSTTKEYVRLLARHRGKKRGGSRVYQMLARRGPVETLRRLVQQPTEGLEFLVRIGRLDLAAETLALKPEYESILDEVIIVLARANLASATRSKK